MAKGKAKKKLSKKEQKALKKRAALIIPKKEKIEIEEPKKEIVKIPEAITVRDFSSKLNLPVTEVMKILIKNGVLATINESIDWETAAIVGDELGFEIKLEKEAKVPKKPEVPSKGKLVPRPPVVTVMGHVDHGKTMLLDTIRQTDIVSQEAGKITQAIGAYQIEHKGRKITFIDTPGHEAFETMRAHGANITDIVILVVAADEGIKPQTKEALKHAKEAGVPIIVAINKIDLPNANIPRVKKQLSEIGLTPEDLGGKTVCVPISAKQNLHIDELLEMILLVADLKKFQADPKKPASGVVVESHLDPKLGPVASLLIQNGTLAQGDFVVVGETWGKIRVMEDEHKKRLKKALPSDPAAIAGLKSLPSFGQIFQVVPDEKTAQIVLADLKKVKAGKIKGLKLTKVLEKEIPIVLKADVLGSLGAVLDNLRKTEEFVVFKVVSQGVGNITEDDVMTASSGKARIIGFKVKISSAAKKLAEREKVRVSLYEIIYDLISDFKKALSSLVKKEVEIQIGKGKILRIFRMTKKEKIIGVKIESGKAERGLTFKAKRGKEEIGKGKVISLQIGKEKVEEVKTGQEAGLGITTESELQEGDLLEFYRKEVV